MDSRPRLLTNHEVWLAIQKRLSLHDKNTALDAPELEEALWALNQTESFLASKASKQSVKRIRKFIEVCKNDFPPLMDGELIQLINIVPREVPILYTIIDQCESRFSQEQITLLLENITEYLA